MVSSARGGGGGYKGWSTMAFSLVKQNRKSDLPKVARRSVKDVKPTIMTFFQLQTSVLHGIVISILLSIFSFEYVFTVY
jgi:hypothetical protein